MASETPDRDIQTQWQNQPHKPVGVSVEEIRSKAQRLQKRARREVLQLYGFALLFVVFFGRAFAQTRETLPRVGLALLVATALYFPVQAQKRIWPRRSAPEAALTTCLDFYRKELERRRDYARQIWRWLLGPLFFGLGVFLLPVILKAFRNPGLWTNLLPFGVLLTIWAALFFPRHKRELRRLQREIDALNDLQSSSAGP